MNAISTGIYTKGIAAGNFNTSIGGRLYFVKAPQNPTYPFVVFFLFNHNIECFYNNVSDSTEAIDDITCQFNIHSNNINSSSEAGTILGYLLTQFNNTRLTISGYRVHRMEVKNIYGPFWIEEDENWVYSVEFNFVIQKS